MTKLNEEEPPYLKALKNSNLEQQFKLLLAFKNSS